MAFDGGAPRHIPLHDKAIVSAKERADRIESAKLDAEVPEKLTDTTIDAGKLSRFPVYALEPYQYQRGASLAKALEILGSDTYGIDDIILAAAFIESGKLPDA